MSAAHLPEKAIALTTISLGAVAGLDGDKTERSQEKIRERVEGDRGIVFHTGVGHEAMHLYLL